MFETAFLEADSISEHRCAKGELAGELPNLSGARAPMENAVVIKLPIGKRGNF